jgi:hypothetical protein
MCASYTRKNQCQVENTLSFEKKQAPFQVSYVEKPVHKFVEILWSFCEKFCKSNSVNNSTAAHSDNGFTEMLWKTTRNKI